MMELNPAKNSAHLVCQRFNFLVVMNYSKLSWSVMTLTGIFEASSSDPHYSEHLTMTNSSCYRFRNCIRLKRGSLRRRQPSEAGRHLPFERGLQH